MNLEAEPSPGELHTLQTISRVTEFNTWKQKDVDMRITRTATGGFSAVYCVSSPTPLLLILVVQGTYGRGILSQVFLYSVLTQDSVLRGKYSAGWDAMG
jgi:hypothetical protein